MTGYEDQNHKDMCSKDRDNKAGPHNQETMVGSSLITGGQRVRRSEREASD